MVPASAFRSFLAHGGHQVEEQRHRGFPLHIVSIPQRMVFGDVPPTNLVGGYYMENVNMDGDVKYTGTGNDRDVILQTIGGVVPTAVRVEQIP